MPEIHAERRIVKSPPELWAELSEAESLGRRLEEFGEVRITRLEPERTVAWEGDDVSGTVELEASGWGTKVTLTVATPGQAPADAPLDDAPPAPATALAATQGPPPQTPLPEIEIAGPVLIAEPEPEPEIAPAAPAGASVPPPGAAAGRDPGPAPRRGLIARLLGRHRRTAAAPPEPAIEDAVDLADGVTEEAPAQPGVPDPAVGEVTAPTGGVAEIVPEPHESHGLPEPAPSEDGDGSAPEAPVAPEPADSERVESVLAAVLDDLGAAHHRPFSRG